MKKIIASLLTLVMILSSGIFVMAQGVGIEAEEDQPTFETRDIGGQERPDHPGGGGDPVTGPGRPLPPLPTPLPPGPPVGGNPPAQQDPHKP